MVAYVDKDYFVTAYLGDIATTSDADFNRLSARASDVVDSLTMHKIPLKGGIEEFVPFIQNQVKMAVSSQIDYYILNGGYDSLITDNLATVSVGKFSYSDGNAGSIAGSNKTQSTVKSYLAPTGLLHRGIGVHTNEYQGKTHTT